MDLSEKFSIFVPKHDKLVTKFNATDIKLSSTGRLVTKTQSDSDRQSYWKENWGFWEKDTQCLWAG